MSQAWNLIHGDLDDFHEWLEFLLSIRKTHSAARTEIEDGETSKPMADDDTVDESLAFLISRNLIWRRWVANYNERTKIRISLFSNLASQNDHRTNLQIAGFTSEIAKEAQQDSSGMKT
jgi:hypothetical protein